MYKFFHLYISSLNPGFSLGLDDMEGDLSPPYGGGQVQGDKAVIGGDGWGGTYTLWGGPILRIVFNPKR